MQISTILDHIDNRSMALPEFQRGYVWNRDQVRGLMDSLYRRHPVGSLLTWVTTSDGADHRGGGDLPPGTVKLLLDGQQRMTSLYGLIRGQRPPFFDGSDWAFSKLHFHLGTEEFSFYQPIKMADDPLWVDVTGLLKGGNDGVGDWLQKLSGIEGAAADLGTYVGRLNRLLGVRDIDLHIEEVTGADKTIDVVVDIFNRVNSGGTKLSKGDLALAKICADWPDARERMKGLVKKWADSGYNLEMDWLLRNVNTVTNGEAKFLHMHSLSSQQVQDGMDRAEKAVDKVLNLIGGRLGLDHNRVLFGRYAIPVMAHYVDRAGQLDTETRDRLLYWYLQCAMWGRYSGSTESFIDQDLQLIEELDGGLERLVQQLSLWHGGLRVVPDHFKGWSKGARFYPVLYLLTRVGEARDWGSGLPLKADMFGTMSKLEVHHIFPKAQLRRLKYTRPQVNAVANFCFQTKETNLAIGAKKPKEYLPEIEAQHPGALASQWIPEDPDLWELDNYPAFLEERQKLLAAAANAFLDELAHGISTAPEETVQAAEAAELAPRTAPNHQDEVEEQTLEDLAAWVVEQGLPAGHESHEVVDEETGASLAIFDLAWPDGMQVGLSQPVAVLLNEGPETVSIASQLGYMTFTDVQSFKAHVRKAAMVDQEEVTGA